jgi:hypothetical protein
MKQSLCRVLALVGLALGSGAPGSTGHAGGAGPPKADSEFPQVVLTNGLVRMAVFLPDAERGYYRGLRFDWSGIVGQAEYGGHTFYGPWRAPHDPLNHDDVSGPAEEFGPTMPLGYAEAKPGGAFVKIGVGEIEKIDEPAYRFWYRYRLLRPGAWEVRHGKEWIEFRQDFAAGSGWGYHYEKRIALAAGSPAFSITHQLRNNGSRALVTDQYCHNFTRIDGTPAGPEYRLALPFALVAKEQTELHDLAELRGQEVVLRREFKEGESIMAFLGGFRDRAADYGATIEHRQSGAALEFHADQPPARYNLWATRTALCPEPYLELNLKPGQERRWQTSYQFATGKCIEPQRHRGTEAQRHREEQ